MSDGKQNKEIDVRDW